MIEAFAAPFFDSIFRILVGLMLMIDQQRININVNVSFLLEATS